jgi:predicted dehydrogenase
MSSNSNSLRIGLLGAGWFGREAHLRNLVNLEGVAVTAASSRSGESLAAAKAIGGEPLRTFSDWREVVALEDLDAIVVALTNDQHHAAAIAALRAGKHVFCEKPLGLTLAECDGIIAAAAEAGRILQVGHEMRFQRLYVHMKEMIDRGEIGDLQLMWCREFRGPMRPGWRSSEAVTGGAILEKNVHHFDLFNWMMDCAPVRVSAHGGTNVLKDREILDNAQVLVEYEGGRRASLELCLFAPKGGDCEIGACGDKGRIDTRNQAPERAVMQIADEGDAANFVDSSGRIDRGIKPQLEHFIECIRHERVPLNDGTSARRAVAVCLAAQESIRRKETVWMEEFAG